MCSCDICNIPKSRTDRLLFNTVHSKITRLSSDKIGLEQIRIDRL